MWMEVGRVKAEILKLTIKDLQENHEYLIRIYAKNEVGFSEPLESEEPFKILPASGKSKIHAVILVVYCFLFLFVIMMNIICNISQI